jgi:hypothetical protein
MLFNSVEFLFFFLPLTLLLYHLLRHHVSVQSALFLLIIASLFFLCLVATSLFNFTGSVCSH